MNKSARFGMGEQALAGRFIPFTWSDGVLDSKSGHGVLFWAQASLRVKPSCATLRQKLSSYSFKPITPVLHHSNTPIWGEAPKFTV